MATWTANRYTRGGLLLGVLTLALSNPALAQPAKSNPVVEENSKPGSLDWQLTRVRLGKRDGFRSPSIEGYCSHQSVQAGDGIFEPFDAPEREAEIDRDDHGAAVGAEDAPEAVGLAGAHGRVG